MRAVKSFWALSDTAQEEFSLSTQKRSPQITSRVRHERCAEEFGEARAGSTVDDGLQAHRIHGRLHIPVAKEVSR
jgi:hypothetical protein